MAAILSWLYNQPLSQTIRTSLGLLFAIRLVHFVAIAFVVASISRVDFRLMGIAHKRTPVTELLGDYLPWTWRAFGVAAVTGLLLFVSNPPGFYGNQAFRLKILFIGLAVVNMAVFHVFAYRGVASWDDEVPTIFAAKLAGALSLAFWIAATVFGALIGDKIGR